MKRLIELYNEPNISALVGGNKAGKTNLIRYLLCNYPTGRIFIFTTVAFNGDFDFLPDKCFFPPTEQGVQKAIANIMKNVRIPSVMIFDDSGMTFRSDFLKGFLGRVRHYNTRAMFTGRTAGQIPHDVREVAQWACLFSCTTKKKATELCDCFGQEAETERDFKDMIKKLKQYHFLFYERNSEVPYVDMIAPYQPDPPPFVIKKTTKAP